MLGDISRVQKYFIICGHTDMRQGIEGLRCLVSQKHGLNPYESCAFLFCGRRKDRLKVLVWEGDGFCLLYKRFEDGSLKWPKNAGEAREITPRQLRWLLDGLTIDPKHCTRDFDTSNL